MTAAPEITFEQFLLSLATAALVHLGELENPDTRKKAVDLPLAKQNIDILGMLREKTRGNLSEGEHKLLEGMLGQLRMQYVSAAGG